MSAIKQYVAAVVVAPWAVPLVYGSVLAVYAGRDPFDAEPLLPGHLAAVLVVAYEVTLVVALPLWLLLARRWRISYQIAALSGLALGVSTALVFARLRTDYRLGFLLWTGGLGGVLAAVIFRAVVGTQKQATAAGQRSGN